MKLLYEYISELSDYVTIFYMNPDGIITQFVGGVVNKTRDSIDIATSEKLISIYLDDCEFLLVTKKRIKDIGLDKRNQVPSDDKLKDEIVRLCSGNTQHLWFGAYWEKKIY